MPLRAKWYDAIGSDDGNKVMVIFLAGSDTFSLLEVSKDGVVTSNWVVPTSTATNGVTFDSTWRPSMLMYKDFSVEIAALKGGVASTFYTRSKAFVLTAVNVDTAMQVTMFEYSAKTSRVHTAYTNPSPYTTKFGIGDAIAVGDVVLLAGAGREHS